MELKKKNNNIEIFSKCLVIVTSRQVLVLEKKINYITQNGVYIKELFSTWLQLNIFRMTRSYNYGKN